MAIPEEADVVITWPDGRVWRGRVFAGLSEVAPTEWVSGALLAYMGERELPAAEREAVRVQIDDAQGEFQGCMGRRRGPRVPGSPRVDVRAIRGRAGDTGEERVLWLSSTEIADRLRSIAGELGAAEARLKEVAAARYATAEDQRAALVHASAYAEVTLQRWTKHLREEAERVTGVNDGSRWAYHQPED